MEPLLQWSAPEFAKVERGVFWHLGSLVIAVLLGLFALWQANYLFLLFIVVAEVLILFMGRQKPEIFEYVITHEGIVVDERMVYNFKTLEAFAISDDNLSEYVELVLDTKKQLAQHVRLLMPRTLTAEAHALMSPRLPEFIYEEGIGDILMKRFGL